MCHTSIPTLRRTILTALPAMAVLAAIAPPQRVDAQSTTYYACYVPSSGTVYRIREADLQQQCSSTAKKGVIVQHVEFSWTSGSSGPSGVTSHGALSGLSADDHAQYLLTEGVRTSIDGFAVNGTYGQGSIPATGDGTRFMWYPRKAALRAGAAFSGGWNDANIGNYSIALGSHVIASQDFAVALGSNAFATGFGATAIGYSVAASGGASTALGLSTKATGTSSTAMGNATQASGTNATSLGYSTLASGIMSTAMGHTTTASGPSSVAIGLWSTASGGSDVALGHRAHTNGRLGAIVLSARTSSNADVKAVADGQFVARASRFWFGNNENVTAPAGQLIATSTGAYLSTGGAWVNTSDVNRKSNFAIVAGEDVLAKLAVMPIQTWNYRDEDTSVRHMGPTAQDFRAAFGLGASETAIATVDADGVSLAAIKALEKRTTDLQRENAALHRSIGALQDANDELNTRIRTLEERIEQIARSARLDQ